MKHLFLFEELTGAIKEETEIIYRDKKLVCLIPKSVETSAKFGRGTAWCSTQPAGFTINSLLNSLMFRFLFKNKRKLRLTYSNKGFDWAQEDGRHHFQGGVNKTVIKQWDQENPFNLDWMENRGPQDMKELIMKIPFGCKEKVLELINKHLQSNQKFDYKAVTGNPENPVLLKKFLLKYQEGYFKLRNYLMDKIDEICESDYKLYQILNPKGYYLPKTGLSKSKRKFWLIDINNNKTYYNSLEDLESAINKTIEEIKKII